MEYLLFDENYPLALDGAFGSILETNGVVNKDTIWSARALIENEQKIINIHQEYIVAGADIITTNTFRTNPAVMKKYNLDFKVYVNKAVELCRIAAQDKNVFIAGSNPPAEDCYQIERTLSKNILNENHCLHITELFRNDVSFILNETVSHYDEIEIICEFCSQNKIPFIVSLYFNDEGKILSGETLEDVINDIVQYKPLAIGYNCISYAAFKKVIINNYSKYNYGFYLNCYEQQYKNRLCSLAPIEYKSIVKEMLKYKPVFVGSCCGSSPSHTRIIKDVIHDINLN